MPTVGSDLDKYGWLFRATVTAVDSVNKVVTLSGNFWLLAPGYGYDDPDTEYLEKASFTSLKLYLAENNYPVEDYLLLEPGTRQPAGWPVPVDWSAANPAYFRRNAALNITGDGIQYLGGTILAPIPDAGTMALFATGLLPAMFALRKRQK